jgi:hypothetical protein
VARRKRGEGSCYQRNDGSWVAQYKGQYKYAKTEELARQKLYAMLGLTRFRGPIRVKRSSSMKGVEEDGQERQTLLA